ncbi:site-specific integrase [Ktedonobacter racemifer]|uniref:site-specific integrase n=1 Tax=Ktedonobacter racemifer TaxID=363277 RepID=UPI0006991853|nr:tyrosine-type recombinase/integrase [Ktedonobacter racemifer]
MHHVSSFLLLLLDATSATDRFPIHMTVGCRAKEHDQGRNILRPGQSAPAWTVQEYLEYWLSAHGPTIRAISLMGYRHAVNRINKIVGNVKLKALKADKIQLAYGTMLKNGFKPRTIQTTHTIFAIALNDAVDWEYLPSNPASKVTPPKAGKREYTLLDMDEAKRLIDAAGDTPIRAIIALAVGTGMRKAEITALKWSSIDLDAKKLYVAEGAVYVKLDETPGQIVENDPKTSSGRRSLTLPDFVIDELRAHKIRQKEQRLKAGAAWVDHGLVFTNRRGGHIYVSINEMFKRVLAQAGLPDMRLHDLRHSLASILLAMGVHPKVVQEILGHSSITITMNIYSHVMPSMHSAAVEGLNAKFKGGDLGENAI